MEILKEPTLFDGSSIIDGKIINDYDIFRNIGYDNYVMLNRKYPLYFKYFDECKTKTDGIGFIPGRINIFISSDPEEIKKDIIKTMHYNIYISKNSELLCNVKKLECKPTQLCDSTSIWIFVCIIMIILLVFSVYVLNLSPHMMKIFAVDDMNYFGVKNK